MLPSMFRSASSYLSQNGNGVQFRRISSSTIWNKMRSILGTNKALIPATAIFHNCKAQSDNQLWHSRGLVKPNFRGKHALLMVHLWMVHKRLLSENIPNGKDVQEAMFDFLWEDTCSRIRQAKVNELSVNKHLKGVQAFSFKTCIELDQSLKMNSEDEIITDIGGAVWRSVYDRREDVTDEHVLEFAKYIRREQLSLIDVPSDNVLQGTFQWGPFPNWQQPSADHKYADDLSSEWRTAISQEGKTYYWNIKTMESVWELPSEKKK